MMAKKSIKNVLESNPLQNLIDSQKQSTPPTAVGSPIAGAYDPNKGGYVTTTGQVYPTKNPDFVPTITDESVTFNKDKTVTYKKGGKEFNLTAEEYKTLLNGTGMLTKNVQEIRAQPSLEQQARIEEAQQVGVIPTQPIEAVNPDLGQAIGAGVLGAASGIIGGATLGAIKGGSIGGAPAAVGGAVIGGLGTIATSIISNLRGQLAGELNAKGQSVTKAETNLRALITDTNANPANAARNMKDFNAQLALLEREYGALKLETNRNLNKWLSKDGTEQLQRYELFYSGSRDFLVREMQSAILNPDPTKNLITLDDAEGLE